MLVPWIMASIPPASSVVPTEAKNPIGEFASRDGNVSPNGLLAPLGMAERCSRVRPVSQPEASVESMIASVG